MLLYVTLLILPHETIISLWATVFTIAFQVSTYHLSAYVVDAKGMPTGCSITIPPLKTSQWLSENWIPYSTGTRCYILKNLLPYLLLFPFFTTFF